MLPRPVLWCVSCRPGISVLAILMYQAAAPASSDQAALNLFNGGKYHECFELIAPYVRQHPEDSSGHKILGMDEYMLGNAKGALEEVKRAAELNPRDADAFYYLGRLYFSTDDPISARAAFEEVLKLDPSSVKAHNQLGQTYEALGRSQEAEREYQEAVRLEASQLKKSEWPYYNLGLLYLNAGQTERSIPYFRKAIECNSQFTQVKVKLAIALSKKQSSEEEALTLLQAAVQEDPQKRGSTLPVGATAFAFRETAGSEP